MEDIGTIQSFYEANLGLTDFVHPAFSFYDTHAPIITHQRFLPPSKILQADVQQAMICEGCIIREAVIRRSIIGVRSIIRSHSQIENSLVMGADYYQSREAKEADKQKGLPSVGIGQDPVIRKAIIDKMRESVQVFAFSTKLKSRKRITLNEASGYETASSS